MKFLALSLLLVSTKAFAGSDLSEGDWINNKIGHVAIETDSVEADGKTFKFGEEEIVDLKSARLGNKILCKATTRKASRAETGEVVVVEAVRERVSSSVGSCSNSRDVNSFSKLNNSSEMVLSLGKSRSLKLKKIEFPSGKVEEFLLKPVKMPQKKGDPMGNDETYRKMGHEEHVNESSPYPDEAIDLPPLPAEPSPVSAELE